MRLLSQSFLKIPVLVALLVQFVPLLTYSQIDGEKLFKTNCSACHAITAKKLIGPGLAGVEERWEDKALLYQWIKNSASVLEMGDPYATQLYEKYNKSIMPAQPVNDEEITAILAYVANPPVVADAAPAAGEGLAQLAEKEPTIQPWIVLLGVVVLLYILMSLLRSLQYTLRKIEADKEGLPVPEQLSLSRSIGKWIGANKTLFALMLIVLGVVSAKAGWDALFTIGIYQGYEPEQPIAFSHKIHAGAQKIDCNYCHSAARHGKSAGIPTANVCMNCHTYIQEGAVNGTEEISKIYAANGYDPEAGSYTAESEGPIKWVKIHNLPDHAYFNHSQHVTVGKVACQTCHGPIEEMDVVQQWAPLTMGWCINCHRETKVSAEGNGYYDEIHSRFTEEMKKEFMKDGVITVSEYGGIECAKCHY
ncbi:MAG: c-type cytochrome [Vicingaceae bacterium]